MKTIITRLFFTFIIVLGFSLNSSSQELGIRFGGTNKHGGAAIDGVFNAGKFNRIHADLGIYNGGVGLDGLWDFVYKPLGKEAFNWYLGVGPSVFLGDHFWLGMSGEIGIEYRFNIVPIAMGLDWRPAFYVVKETQFSPGSFGFNVRYVFGR